MSFTQNAFKGKATYKVYFAINTKMATFFSCHSPIKSGAISNIPIQYSKTSKLLD